MKPLFSSLKKITPGTDLQLYEDHSILDIFLDSRNVPAHRNSLFFAISGAHHDGHQFIETLYQEGVRNFVVEKKINLERIPQANVFLADSSISVLQALSGKKRQYFEGKIIAITGSNGKTITKEWLGQLMDPFFAVYRSPRSFNSQIGVPLSLWPLSDYQDYGIIEAGISKVGEMERLQETIRPDIGIFTNIGTAHDEGFSSLEEKAIQKAQLFKGSTTIIYCKDYPEIAHALHSLPDIINKNLIGWSFEDNSAGYYVETEKNKQGIAIRVPFREKFHIFDVPFTDSASLENIVHCLFLLLNEGIPTKLIQNSLRELKPVAMRLEVKQAIHQTYLVDDSYNNDLVGLDTAIQFFRQQKQFKNRVIILSDMLESGLEDHLLYHEVADKIHRESLDLFIGVGKSISAQNEFFPEKSIFFDTTEDLILYLRDNPLRESVVLIKGARSFHFENIVKELELKIHGTVLEINLNAITHNLNFYRAKLKPRVKTMAMVKAFAYGSGSHEIANWLQYQKVDYLAVAYADEGVTLRRHGIYLPIMVMNPGLLSFELLAQYDLEPELYSIEIFQEYANFIRGKGLPSKVHIKLDTGMHRLGFEQHEMTQLFELLRNNPLIKVASIFSHLVGSDEAIHNGFSAKQAFAFKKMSEELINVLNYRPILHLLNSPGISRFPDFQFDMVRLGVGLHGVDATQLHQDRLLSVSVLKTVISQVKNVKQGETIGYSRKGVAEKNIKIATIAIGYADGFDRKFSNGVGKVSIKGQLAAVIGNVSMDMCMVDITDIDCKAGDEVIIFGKSPTLLELAKSIDTIPYEILTNVSDRVKRVFYSE
ncbi:bifunctional UDP-N-acetylmuramoyl-tripeptide:D-alanyl-D-alanine ligase/alanine racemase [Marivirga sp. S37H4]|uniref:Alanine racemase n=1 Tax=Marivirga aurantiaca TaxID=2802615 RepID=A0A934WZR6_9BACT|nr:bifunctional UDP-N-acetylmuramoyl-tripeptide:D-alanyl-D-alanine ligase/alanine racemase [Marivirga aurantiaca]MBK6265896.1 bifunctional UDP-N-acetylmuramoyl-tripeptide:D-alanyl-D-alanine ligase/alanine racemase [Marivirga aurantiaca]